MGFGPLVLRGSPLRPRNRSGSFSEPDRPQTGPPCASRPSPADRQRTGADHRLAQRRHLPRQLVREGQVRAARGVLKIFFLNFSFSLDLLQREKKVYSVK